MPEAVPQAELPLTPPPVPKRFELPAEPKDAPKAVEAPVEKSTPETPAASDELATEVAQDTEDSATPAEPEAKPEEVTPEQAAKREGRRFERKLDKVIKARAEAEAKAEAETKRAAELEQKLAELSKPKAEGRKTLADFDYDPEKYASYTAEEAKKQAVQEVIQRQQQEAQTQAQRKIKQDWEAKVLKAEDKFEDFEEKVGNLEPVNHLTWAVMDADPVVAYHLATHMDEADRLSKLPPVSAVREIGKLEAKLLSETPKPKAPSKAPAPIKPLTGAATQATEVPTEQDDYKTWLSKRNKQLGRK